MLRTKRVTKGDWRTVETFWNARGISFFRLPAGTQAKVRYGGGWLGFDRHKQTLNGKNFKRPEVGFWSRGYARMQVKTGQALDINYDIYGDGVARSSPEIPF